MNDVVVQRTSIYFFSGYHSIQFSYFFLCQNEISLSVTKMFLDSMNLVVASWLFPLYHSMIFSFSNSICTVGYFCSAFLLRQFFFLYFSLCVDSFVGRFVVLKDFIELVIEWASFRLKTERKEIKHRMKTGKKAEKNIFSSFHFMTEADIEIFCYCVLNGIQNDHFESHE